MPVGPNPGALVLSTPRGATERPCRSEVPLAITMKSAMSVRPRTSSTLTSKAFISAKASITTVSSEGLALDTLPLSTALGLPEALDLPAALDLPEALDLPATLGLSAAFGLLAALGMTTALLRSFILVFEAFFLTGTTLSVFWNSSWYPG